MQLHLLPSDYMVYLLFFGVITATFYIRSQPHYREPWKKVFENKIAMVTAVILLMYVMIGLLDSVHFTNQRSLLDIFIQSLKTHDETTYSAPFAVSFHVIPFGNLLIKGFLWGFVSFLILLLLGYWIVSMSTSAKTPSQIAWKTGLITASIIWTMIVTVAFLTSNYHIFGTDKIGEDVFYESVKSIRTGLLIGTLTTIFMLPFALVCGTLAGYFGGMIDDVIQYLYTTLSSIPGVLLITAMVLVMQVIISNHPQLFPTIADRADARLLTLCFILGITSWSGLCRLLRAETLKLREQDFITASIAMGARPIPIIFRHIWPNVMHIVIITTVLDFSGLVLAEAVLSYVGVGVDPTTASWGNMINTSRLELAREPAVWWPLCAALVMMFFLVLSANLFADSVRDAFDPRG